MTAGVVVAALGVVVTAGSVVVAVVHRRRDAAAEREAAAEERSAAEVARVVVEKTPAGLKIFNHGPHAAERVRVQLRGEGWVLDPRVDPGEREWTRSDDGSFGRLLAPIPAGGSRDVQVANFDAPHLQPGCDADVWWEDGSGQRRPVTVAGVG